MFRTAVLINGTEVRNVENSHFVKNYFVKKHKVDAKVSAINQNYL
jgi:hypothetical protein